MMKNLFNKDESERFIEKYSNHSKDLALRVYTSRLIGKDTSLVLHGGGNTSVKVKIKDITGEENDVIYVKGSGSDLSSIEPEGFASLNLLPLKKLRTLGSLSDEIMDNQLKIHAIWADSPAPSVETIVHAFLPHKYIDHSHADSVLILTNQRDGENIVKEALGEKAAVLPYIMSGFPLAKAMIERFEKNPDIEAIVIMYHGIFTFAEDAKTSYDRMIEYVNRADQYIESRIKGVSLCKQRTDAVFLKNIKLSMARFAQTARGVCAYKMPGDKLRRFHVEIRSTPELIEASLSENAERICSSGVLTPDHVIRTKNRMVYIESVPKNDDDLRDCVKQKVDAFTDKYHRYFNQHVTAQKSEIKEKDPFPRLFFVAGIGIVALGFTRKDACIAADIAEHTIRAKLRAEAMGGYLPVSDDHIFDMEHWIFQQKKLHKASDHLLEGQVAVVTGGAGAIGLGIAKQLLNAGAVVIISDIDKQRLDKVYSILAQKHDKSRVGSIVFDVTDYQSVEKGFCEISCRFGGIDIVVPNAGIAHVATIEDLDPEKFDQVIDVNLKGTFNVLKSSVPVFKRQGTGGNVVVISSKNVFDPGVAFGAYSASKAGAHQISKIAAMEFAKFGVKVNMINPDAVFGDAVISSKLWDLIGPDRMKSRGLDAEGLKEYYRNRNLLKKSVLAEHVGNAVVFFASDMTPTTGASLPIDGGISSAFPR